MKKLKLNLDHLAVESFDTAGAKDGTGTVMGHDTIRCSNTCDTVDNYTCNGQYTCGGATCQNLYTCRLDSCGNCGTMFCASDNTCTEPSQVWTCDAAVDSCSCPM